MKPEDYSDYFDSYLESKLSHEDRLIFEKKLSDDSEFKLQFEAHKAVINNFRELGRCNLKSDLKVFHNEMIRKVIVMRRRFTWGLSIAAVFTGLVVFTIWQPTQYSNQAIFNEYSVSFSNKLVVDNNYGELTRGDECSLENLTTEECEQARDALISYDKSDFISVVRLLEPMLSPKEKNQDLLLYLAISQLKTGSIIKAEENLEYLSEISGYKYKEQADFYLSLAFINQGNLSKARAKLKTIEVSRGVYSITASEILKKMRWF